MKAAIQDVAKANEGQLNGELQATVEPNRPVRIRRKTVKYEG